MGDLPALLDLLQWPAMATTLAAAWWIGSKKASKRIVAFWLFISGNLMWIGWGWGADAWALIALQVGLIAINVRGILKNEAP